MYCAFKTLFTAFIDWISSSLFMQCSSIFHVLLHRKWYTEVLYTHTGCWIIPWLGSTLSRVHLWASFATKSLAVWFVHTATQTLASALTDSSALAPITRYQYRSFINQIIEIIERTYTTGLFFRTFQLNSRRKTSGNLQLKPPLSKNSFFTKSHFFGKS